MSDREALRNQPEPIPGTDRVVFHNDAIGVPVERAGLTPEDPLGTEPPVAAPVPDVSGVPLLGWAAAGRCAQDRKWVHVSEVRAQVGEGARALAEALDYDMTATVDSGHACGVPAVYDPES